MKRIRIVLASVFRLFIFMPILLVSYFFPKDKNLWIFGSWFGLRYADNTRYMYEYLLQHDGIKPVWITKNKSLIPVIKSLGGRVYYAYSFKGILTCMRAGRAFYVCGMSDISEYFVCGAQKIMFWHGIPLKKIIYDDDLRYPGGLLGRVKLLRDVFLRAVLPDKRQNWDYVVSSSELVTSRLASAFRIKKDRILEVGYPRQDILSEAPALSGENRVFLYAPTHRQEGRGNFTALDFFKDFEFEVYDELFRAQGVQFIINLHYYHDSSPLCERLQGLTNISLYLGGDIYDLLGRVDLLITDYSSIYIDYLFLGRRIVFYSFDYDEYVSEDRGLYEDYIDSAPGIVCFDWGSVVQVALNGMTTAESAKLEAARDRYFKFKSGGARERVLQYLNSGAL